jgi:hypothetical protein
LHRPLTLHADARSDAVAQIAVEVERPGPRALVLRYRLIGSMSGVRIPPPAAPDRTDELWRSTCLEAFVRATGEAYYEFNFAPSGRWAVYRFTRYRAGMTAVQGMSAPRIDVQSNEEGMMLQASLELGGLADLPGDRPWRLGVSAVIEALNGDRSYWALAHAPGKPDFHHADGFVLDAPPPGDLDRP